MINGRIAEIRARLSARTPGEWEQTGIMGSDDPDNLVESDAGSVCDTYESENVAADACFIAHAPKDIEDLLAEVVRLRKREASTCSYNECQIRGTCTRPTGCCSIVALKLEVVEL